MKEDTPHIHTMVFTTFFSIFSLEKRGVVLKFKKEVGIKMRKFVRVKKHYRERVRRLNRGTGEREQILFC